MHYAVLRCNGIPDICQFWYTIREPFKNVLADFVHLLDLHGQAQAIEDGPD